MRALSLPLLLLCGLSCQSRTATRSPVQLSWEVPEVMTTDVCATLVLHSPGLAQTLKVTLDGLSNARAYLSPAACSANQDKGIVSHMTLPANTEAVTLTLRDAVAEALHIEASGPGILAAQANVTVQALTVLGQPDTHTNRSVRLGLAYPGPPFVVGNKLVVPDRANGRVLIWSPAPTSAKDPPTLVLGQANADSLDAYDPPGGGPPAAITGASMGPVAVWSDGTRLAVVDAAFDRVLVWNTFPTQNNQAADFALGRPAGANNLTQSAANPAVSAESLLLPNGVFSDGTRLYVSDGGFNRLLVWENFPTAPTPADFALGQPAGSENLTRRDDPPATNASTFQPSSVWGVGTRLLVGDLNAGRVLVWLTTPTVGQAADFALGVPAGPDNLTTAGATSPSGIPPAQVSGDANRLLVSDDTTARVLVWNHLPAVAGAAPDAAMGQRSGPDNLTSTDTDLVLRALGASDGIRLWMTDPHAHRLLAWKTFPDPGEPPSFVWGAPTLDLALGADAVLPSATQLRPDGISSHGDHLFVADSAACRVLVWRSLPRLDNMPADFALGVPGGANNLTRNGTCKPTATTFSPSAVWTDGSRLVVADAANHRVLVWNQLPLQPDTPADFALGQPNDAHNLQTGMRRPLGANSLNLPSGLASFNGKLFVTDAADHRVLVWQTFPIAGGTPADFALGQPAGADNLTSNDPNVGPGSLRRPSAVAVGSGQLYVADTDNARVLVWPTLPTAGGTPAAFALGVPAGTSNLTRSGNDVDTTPPEELSAPMSLYTDGARLAVGDARRVLVWTGLPRGGGQAASLVYGKVDPAAAPTWAALDANTLGNGAGVWGDATRLWVADDLNARVVLLPFPYY